MNATRTTRRWRHTVAGAALASLMLVAAGASAQIVKFEKLTEEQLGRLRKVALDKGSTLPVPAPLVGVLRLSPPQIAPTLRQVSFQGEDGVKNGFARLNDDSGYFFFRKAPTGLSAFHVDASLKLVAAAHDFAAERFIALPEKDAQDELNAEMLAWSRVLSPRGVSMPAPGARPRAPTDTPVPAPPSAVPPPASIPGTVPGTPAR